MQVLVWGYHFLSDTISLKIYKLKLLNCSLVNTLEKISLLHPFHRNWSSLVPYDLSHPFACKIQNLYGSAVPVTNMKNQMLQVGNF